MHLTYQTSLLSDYLSHNYMKGKDSANTGLKKSLLSR